MSDISSHTPKDNDARAQAIDPSRSFVVSAPAGSGKTGLLTLRVLNLLAVVEKPEEILCITFTRKAAQEMHERIFGALNKAKALQANTDTSQILSPYDHQLFNAASNALQKDKQHNWQLLKTPKRLNISTIDGFCKSLCNQLPLFSSLGTNTGILENPKLDYHAATLNWLNDALKSEHEPLTTLITHLGGKLDKLAELLVQLLGVRDQWLPLIYQSQNTATDSERADHPLKQLFENTLLNWVEHAIDEVQLYFRPYEAELLDLFSYAQSNLDTASDTLELLVSRDEFIVHGDQSPAYWRAIADIFLTKSKPSFRKKLDKRDGFPKGETKEEQAAAKLKKQQMLDIISAVSASISGEQLAALKQLPDIHYRDSQWQVLNALFAILPTLSAYLRLRFAETSSTDFVEFSLAAVNALNANSGHIDLLQRLDYRIKHILIDEFQDTSQTQLELLKSLTAEWLPDDGRSLFLVGDGMQSCYSFRNADVGIFLNMRERGLDNVATESIDLNVNFRSTDTIVRWVNTHFQVAFPDKNDADYGAVRYIPSLAFNASPQTSFVRCVGFATEHAEDTASNLAQFEAEYICSEIRALQQSEPSESIAILVKSRTHIRALIPTLIKHNIAYQALEIDALEAKQAIRDLKSLAHAFTQPSEKLFWLACLRAPFCALSHSDLYAVFGSADKQSLPRALAHQALSNKALSQGGAQRLARFLSCYDKYSISMGRRLFSELLELAWIELGGPELLENEFEIQDAQRFFVLVRAHEQYGQLNWDSFDDSLKKLFATPVSKADNPVRIMTMHKSKGLEFDSVFLPQLHKSPRSDDPELLYWLTRGHLDSPEFVLSPMAADRETQGDTISQFIKAQNQRKRRLEETRVFYVACTRAKQRLFLSAELALIQDTGEVKTPNKHSMLGKIWPTVHNEFVIQPCHNQLELMSQKRTATAIKAFQPHWQSALIKTFEQDPGSTKSGHAFNNAHVDIFTEFHEESVPVKIGVIFHRILQTISKYGFAIFDAHQPAGVSRLQTFLRQSSLALDVQAQWCEYLSQVIMKLKHDRTAQWVLSAQHDGAKSEFQLTESVRNKLITHVIDRTFIDGDTRWIIDFKTSELAQNESVEAFVQREYQQYRDQLQRYRDVMIKHDDRIGHSTRPGLTKVGLYFPFIQVFHHCEALDKSRQ